MEAVFRKDVMILSKIGLHNSTYNFWMLQRDHQKCPKIFVSTPKIMDLFPRNNS